MEYLLFIHGHVNACKSYLLFYTTFGTTAHHVSIAVLRHIGLFLFHKYTCMHQHTYTCTYTHKHTYTHFLWSIKSFLFGGHMTHELTSQFLHLSDVLCVLCSVLKALRSKQKQHKKFDFALHLTCGSYKAHQKSQRERDRQTEIEREREGRVPMCSHSNIYYTLYTPINI